MKRAILELLFPSRCVICRKIITANEHICPGCARELTPTGSQCAQHGDFFDLCLSPFFYAEPLRASFHRYKFNGLRSYALPYGRWMADLLVREGRTDFDLVTWAPLSRLRRWRRGYDQSELLAAEVSRRLSLPLRAALKKAHRKPLSRLEGKKALRSAHILGAYAIARGVDVAGKRILLVDDIVTTGSTLSECARILKTAGAAEVVCITLARRKDN